MLQVPERWVSDAEVGGVRDEPAGKATAAEAPRWWLAIDDPLLHRRIDAAFSSNQGLAQAVLRVQRARLSADQAASDTLPAVSLGGSASASRPIDGGRTSRSLSLTGSVRWEVDFWGRLAALRSVADWELVATDEDRRSALLTLAGNTALQHWQLAYLNQRVAASEQSMAYARRTLSLVEAQQRAGVASGLDLAQATQTLATQTAAHAELQRQLLRAHQALGLLLGATPTAADPAESRLPQGALPLVPAGLPAQLLTRRPDLRAAEARLRKAGAQVQASRTSWFPALTLTGSLGGVSSELSQVLADPVATLGAGLVLPFVQWRDVSRGIALAQADEAIAVAAYRQAWLTALTEVEGALSDRLHYERQGEHLAQAQWAAARSEQLAEARYRAGAVPLKTWLDAQEARRQADNNLSLNRLNRLQALVALYQALGGGAEPVPSPP